MRKTKLIGICLSIFVAQAGAYEFADHVDPTLAKMEKEQDEKCAHIQNFDQEMKCIQEIEDEQAQTGEMRGTKQYCERHYLKLDNGNLEAKLTELVKKKDTAREAGDISPRRQGELRDSSYGIEIECVVKEIQKRGITIHDPAVRYSVRFLYL